MEGKMICILKKQTDYRADTTDTSLINGQRLRAVICSHCNSGPEED